MEYKEQLKKVGEYEYELPKQGKMLVPARLFLSEKLLGLVEENAIQQVVNVAMLPGIVKCSLAMSDMHSGYGFCIGGVAAFDLEKGVISPGGVGYDINCGIRILATNLKKKDILEKKKELLHQISRDIPKGIGKGSVVKLDKKEIKEVLETGAKWAVKNNYGGKEDLEKTEDYGCIENANASDVSERAIARGLPQLGSLGSGNHFLEIQEVDEIYDKEIAEKFGIKEKGQITISIHCGSRGLGHQVASDYIKLMEDKYGWKDLPDRELINAPISSELGKKYLSAMACAANFAFCNRQMIMNWTEKSVKRFFPKAEFNLIYDVCHNIAKIEEHEVDGKKKKLLVCRKGATRSFGKGRKELPKIYQKTGQPVLIPGSMGTASYILVGTNEAEKLSFSSTAHGAGRVCSRSAALRNLRGENIKKELESKGIDIETGSLKGLAEEAPQVYKDIDEIAKVSDKIRLAKLVVRLKPLAVMKG
ncbi:MAG: RtcB family protein [Nanoarchaeota archaeon]